MSQCFLYGILHTSEKLKVFQRVQRVKKGTLTQYALTKPTLCMYGLHNLYMGSYLASIS